MDTRDKLLTGHFIFDKKPFILKAWSPDVDLKKEDLKTLHVWMQLKIALGEHSLH